MNPTPSPASLTTLLGPRIARIVHATLWGWFALVAVTSIVVALHRPRPLTPVFPHPTPAALAAANTHLTSYALGVRAEASSYHFRANHLPFFAIDGVAGSTTPPAQRTIDRLLKWVSAPGDLTPTLTLRWPHPVHLDAVTLVHGSRFEPSEATASTYTLRCLDADGRLQAELVVTDNVAPIATHPLICHEASFLELRFTLRNPREVIRLYEVEAHGDFHGTPR